MILSTNDLKKMLDFTELPNKVILFTDKTSTAPLFAGLTSHFRERLEVIIINNNS